MRFKVLPVGEQQACTWCAGRKEHWASVEISYPGTETPSAVICLECMREAYHIILRHLALVRRPVEEL